MSKLEKSIFIDGVDNNKIFLRIWDNVKNPKGIVQIIHGMAEHSERYREFAEHLNKERYIVCADDHRGHGKSATHEREFGYLGKDGFNKVVEEEHMITEFMKKEYSDLPINIFAHSFGSFVGQEYITRYSNEINSIILSGTAKQDGIDIKLGYIVASIQRKLFDDKSKAKLIDKLSFGSFNKKVENPQHKFAWLTRDVREVEKYNNDEFCGFISTIDFYYNLFGGLKNLYNEEKLQKINKELPILVLAGDKDPVGKYGKSILALHKQYKDLGINKAEVKLFEEGRHELLNETNKLEVYEYVGAWVNKHA